MNSDPTQTAAKPKTMTASPLMHRIFPLIARHAKQMWPARRRQLIDRMSHSSRRAAMIYMHGSDAHVAGAAYASRRVGSASVG
jgi:hypothetical protein